VSVSVTLDMTAATPPYEQVRAQLAGHIRAGALRQGDKLPVVRALAADLGVATNTVARAYRELEAGGLVTTRRRVGTIVQAAASPAGPELRRERSHSWRRRVPPGSPTTPSSTWCAARCSVRAGTDSVVLSDSLAKSGVP